VTGLVRAVRYLTIVPVPARAPGPNLPDSLVDLGRAAPWFPVVGLALGLGLAAVERIAARLFPPLLVALLTIAAWKLMTGGLHLDGLADCLDGLAGRDTEQRLAIMRDSRIGTFAAIGLVLVLLVDVAALAEITDHWRWRALVIAPTVGRATPLLLAQLFPAARRDGHGACFQAGMGRGSASLALALALCVAFGALGWSGLIGAAMGILAALLIGWQFARRLEGITGDVLGAAVEITELAVLLTIAAWTHGRP
jgi:adenosylcobinamide-GDP ribazoletransferase